MPPKKRPKRGHGKAADEAAEASDAAASEADSTSGAAADLLGAIRRSVPSPVPGGAAGAGSSRCCVCWAHRSGPEVLTKPNNK